VARFTKALVGRDTTYFDLFEEAGRNLVEAAALLERMLRGWPDTGALAHEIRALEHEGDRVTHDIIRRLNQTFVTPLDREDIIELASGLDDVADLVEEVADFLGLYKIEAPMEQAVQLSAILHQATRQIAQALPNLRDFADLSAFQAEVHRLENEGDRVTREAIAALFERGIDPMTVIRWKDIYERLEAAIDACEHAANTLEGVVIKNS
jgi:predicted phosphate transport protein (TIGR00153 family)